MNSEKFKKFAIYFSIIIQTYFIIFAILFYINKKGLVTGNLMILLSGIVLLVGGVISYKLKFSEIIRRVMK